MKKLIISHWDTDGIISSAVLARELGGEFDFLIAELGQYSLSAAQIEDVNTKEYEELYIVDFALQAKIVVQLKAGKIIVIDHHFTEKADNAEYHNPVIEGASPDDYPCCVMAVCDFLDKDFLLESSIAAIGDKEHKILTNERFATRIAECEGTLGLGYDQMLAIKNLLDSAYMSGNREGIVDNIRLVKDQGVESVSDSQLLKDQWASIEVEKEQLQETVPDQINDTIRFYELHTDMNLISTTTRALSKAQPDKIIVTRCKQNVYVRRDEAAMDLKPLIELGRAKGWDIGGKHEVCGIVGCSEEMFEEILNYLKSN